MPNHTISESQLRLGTKIFARGNITFSRLFRRVEGEELVKDIQRKRAQGRMPIDKPYRTLTICNATILPTSADGQLSLEEKYVEELFYVSSVAKNTGYSYTVTDKSPYQPSIAQIRDGNPKIVDQVKMTGELDNDLDVVLVLRIYRNNTPGSHTGIALDAVIAQEPIRYYAPNNIVSSLAERGITFNPLPPEALSEEIPAETSPMGAAPQTAPAPAPAVTGNPYMSSQQAVNPAAPAPIPGMNPPTSAPYGVNGAYPPAPQPDYGRQAPVNNPYASPMPAPQQGGIRFDPNSTDRRY